MEKDLKQKLYCNQKTYEFIEKFKAQQGSYLCRDLLGLDIRVPADHNTPESLERHKVVCPDVIGCAVRILEGMEFGGE